MKCPFCGTDSNHVLDSRASEDNTAIRRRRQCGACGRRFTTFEKVESQPMIVIKKDQTREPYDRQKIEAGVRRACYKRPISSDRIDSTVTEVENEIFRTAEREISSTQIGEAVMRRLKELDEVAYVRFASVYREFKDVETFMQELQELMNKKRGDDPVS